MGKHARDGRCARKVIVNKRGTKDESRLWSLRCGGMRRKKISGARDGDDVRIYQDENKEEEGHTLSALIGSVGLLIPSPREGVEVSVGDLTVIQAHLHDENNLYIILIFLVDG